MRKGQASTEYLIILAVVIIVALIVVGVMGWFPGLSSEITADQSRAYWGAASPFSITDFKVDTSGNAEFTLENKLTDKLQLTEIALDGTSLSIDDANFTAGQSTTVNGSGVSDLCSNAGDTFSVEVTISYDNLEGVSGQSQIGAKPLVGTCA